MLASPKKNPPMTRKFIDPIPSGVSRRVFNIGGNGLIAWETLDGYFHLVLFQWC